MNEFDPCPECKEDLLLEDPDSNGKGLKCLECGYACQATESQDDDSSKGVLPGKENEKTAYWKRRCEAAENVIEAVTTKNEEVFFTAHQAWFAVKEDGEPV